MRLPDDLHICRAGGWCVIEKGNMSNILVIEEGRKWLNHVKKALVPPHDLDCWSDEKNIGTFLKQKEYAIILLSLQLEKLDSFGMLKRVKLLSPLKELLFSRSHIGFRQKISSCQSRSRGSQKRKPSLMLLFTRLQARKGMLF